MAGLDLFDFLNGVSPWTWIALGVALGAFEMLTMSFFLIWPGIAAVCVGIILWFFPEMSGSVQVAVFAVLSIAMTVGGRMVGKRLPHPESDMPALNRRSEGLIGRSAKVVEAFAHGNGAVEVDGVRWRARCDAQFAPTLHGTVRIRAVDGIVLDVDPA